MLILGRVYWFVNWAVIAVIVAVVVLVLLRLIANQADLNPFSRTSLSIRRLTDPIIGPVRRALMGFGVDPKYSPLVAILITILLGWFALQLVATVANTLAGVVVSLDKHAVVPVIGYVLYGLLGLYSLLIFIRIIFSWVHASYSHRMMRFLVNVTEPMLAPLRRIVPRLFEHWLKPASSPLRTFDISPIVAFIILWLFQAAIRGTLLKGWQTVFFA